MDATSSISSPVELELPLGGTVRRDAPSSVSSLLIPPTALLKRHPLAAKDVESAPDGEINLAAAEAVDEFQIRNAPATASVRDWYRTDLRQVLDQSFIDAGLQAFGIGCMD